jgi:hypothetical protein
MYFGWVSDLSYPLCSFCLKFSEAAMYAGLFIFRSLPYYHVCRGSPMLQSRRLTTRVKRLIHHCFVRVALFRTFVFIFIFHMLSRFEIFTSRRLQCEFLIRVNIIFCSCRTYRIAVHHDFHEALI